jgi:hypothetical protein
MEFGEDTQLQDRDAECSEGDDKIPKSFENSIDPDDEKEKMEIDQGQDSNGSPSKE